MDAYEVREETSCDEASTSDACCLVSNGISSAFLAWLLYKAF